MSISSLFLSVQVNAEEGPCECGEKELINSSRVGLPRTRLWRPRLQNNSEMPLCSVQARPARSLWRRGRQNHSSLPRGQSFIQVWSWGSQRESAGKTEVMIGNLIMDLTSPLDFPVVLVRIKLLSTRRFHKTENTQRRGSLGPSPKLSTTPPGSWGHARPSGYFRHFGADGHSSSWELDSFPLNLTMLSLLCFLFWIIWWSYGETLSREASSLTLHEKCSRSLFPEDSSPAIASCVLYDLGLDRQRSACFSSSPFLGSPLRLFPACQDRK